MSDPTNPNPESEIIDPATEDAPVDAGEPAPDKLAPFRAMLDRLKARKMNSKEDKLFRDALVLLYQTVLDVEDNVNGC